MDSPQAHETSVSRRDFDAAILDMDGVVTDTATLHASAWKDVFDEFLRAAAGRSGTAFKPFDTGEDYRRFVDGMNRYDGVRRFLADRGIRLPEGSPSDPPGVATVCGLGNKKNELFLHRARRQGIDAYPHTVVWLRRLREEGIRTAVISASHNCEEILQAAQVVELFDARVDGTVAAQEGLKGKPEPDLFLEAARRLGVQPGRALVVEDAFAGVEAGRKGAFRLVVGIDRVGHGDELREHGAHVVVENLTEVPIERNGAPTQALPSALEHVSHIVGRAHGRPIALFLDYDGTLTPIVARPDLATLSEPMRQAVQRLGERCRLAIVSGRDLEDVRRLVAVEGIAYAGSHGFDIQGPDGQAATRQEGGSFLAAIERAEQSLRAALGGVPGALVERKRFGVAAHYRMADEQDVGRVEAAVDEARRANPTLRKRLGKKVFELQPDMDWDKGRAVEWLLDALGPGWGDAMPVYVGDDVTDEDAFRALRGRGVGILVAQDGRPTQAQFAVADVDEVRSLLERLGEHLSRRPS